MSPCFNTEFWDFSRILPLGAQLLFGRFKSSCAPGMPLELEKLEFMAGNDSPYIVYPLVN